NVIGAHSYQGVANSSGTLSGDPQLNANHHPHESPPSPVINSGTNTVPGGLPSHDLDGGPRVTGTTVDRGAYESSINDAFIQTVTNTNDSGAGSLRAAINSANANVSSGALITFDIGSGCGPHVITLNSNLPAIAAPMLINGYSQTGASENTLDTGDNASICVILEAGNSAVDDGLYVSSFAGDSVQAVVQGLAFSGFSYAAIDFAGGSGHGIAGNHFGGNVNGHALQANGVDIELEKNAHDAIIGGADAAERNIIGDAADVGILLGNGVVGQPYTGTYNNQVINNYIGVGWNQNTNSYSNRANAHAGVRIYSRDNTLSGNLIGNNGYGGVEIDGGTATGNLLSGNFIGADADGAQLSNNYTGVGIYASGDQVPHDNTVSANTIANSTSAGVRINLGQHNKVRKNKIYNNGLLGIDIAGTGVTPNDDDGGLQINDYANRGQNFPELTAAAGGANKGTVSGTLTTTPGTYTIDFYTSPGCDNSGYGEGEVWLKGMSVTVPTPVIGDQGTANFNTTIAFPLLDGRTITATATDSVGDTSEFSACITYTNDTIFADGFEPPPA
ncbi:MAG: right-handed parallel beta-helix repeat-containing protein, partial [Rudaea sp.]